MPGRLRLEAFDAPSPREAELAAGAAEEARLEAFEAGYKAGWEDAVAAEAEAQGRLRADLARNLQALSFTYHEARGHVLRALEPLLRAMAAQVLPLLAREALAPIVVETLRPLAEARAAEPFTIVVAPAARAAVESALALEPGLLFRIVEEPTLGEGQVYLRFDMSEIRVDLDAACAAIAAAVDEFFHPTEEALRHG